MSEKKNTFLETNRDLFAIVALSFLVLMVYFQVASFQYINFDDNLYVYENSMVLSGLNWESIKWAFTTFQTGNWHPITWLSLELDVQFWGGLPGPHHIMNVMFHLFTGVLAYLVFERMTGRFLESFAIAALFLVHPTHVESVAWIAERKDVLCGVFWFASMWCYVRWCRAGAKPWTTYYVAALGLFAIGLLAKPMVITLPFVLVLCDIWPLRRSGNGKSKDYVRLLVEKWPFLLLSIASAVVTVIAQRSVGAVQSLDRLPIELRVENSIISYAKYVLMAFWPVKLAVWYPYERVINLGEVVAATAFILLITAICIWQFQNRKYLLVGWLWFLGTMVPVIGLVQVGAQAMADRYTYLPYFGLFMMVVFGVSEITDSLRLDRRILFTVASIVVVILASLSFIQAGKWSDNETLYRYTLAVTKDNYLIAQNLCGHLLTETRIDEAEQFCQASVDIQPDYYPAVNGMGMIHFGRGDYAKAELDFAKAVSISPRVAGSYSNLALSQMLQGKTAEAEATLERATKVGDTSYPPTMFIPALRNLAIAYSKQQNYQKAFENLTRILYLTPEDIDARMNLTFALIKLERFDEAQAHIESITRADPNNAQAHNYFGLVLLGKARNGSAAEQFEAALRLKPDFEEAKNNLKRAKGEQLR